MAQNFFELKKEKLKQIRENNDEPNTFINALVGDNGKLTFSFLDANHTTIHTELSNIFEVIRYEQKGTETKEYWWFALHLCHLLKQYHEQYDQKITAKKYDDKIAYIFDVLKDEHQPKNPEFQSFFAALMADLKRTVNDTSFGKTYRLQKAVSTMNLYRIYWIFCRLTLAALLLLSGLTNAISKLGNYNINSIIDGLESVNPATNVLSVGFFGGTFIIQFMLLCKHIIHPSEKEKSLGRLMILRRELWKRHQDLINNAVWAVVNGITNYAQYINMPPMVASYILVAFLLFDVGQMIYRFAKDRYEYKQKLHEYQTFLADESTTESEKAFTRKQIKALENEWKAHRSKLFFNTVGALMLFGGVLGGTFVTSPFLAPAFMFMCLVGVACYLSSDAFKNMIQKRTEWKSLESDGLANGNAKNFLLDKNKDKQLAEALLKEYKKAKMEFVKTFIENIAMPSIILGAYILCWQAALVLTVLYMGYKLFTRYQEHQKTEKEKQKTLSFNKKPKDIELQSSENLTDDIKETPKSMSMDLDEVLCDYPHLNFSL